MAASDAPTASTCPARSAGSPASTRCGLDVGGDRPRRGPGGRPAAGRALKRVKEQLRAIPDRGLGYGLLRYLNPEAGPRLAGRPTADRASTIWAGSPPGDGRGLVAGWRAGGASAAVRTAAMPLAHPLEVNAVTGTARTGPA